MLPISSCQLPPGALLDRHVREGAYADCYVAEIAASISLAQYVEAFYTTPVFGIERLLLKLFASRLSTDAQAKQLAAGEIETFAAWRVESRSADQLLLADFTGRTRSWLMVATDVVDGTANTRLYFGSAVIPVTDAKSGRRSQGFVFRVLLGFHTLYSRVLLSAARRRLVRDAS